MKIARSFSENKKKRNKRGAFLHRPIAIGLALAAGISGRDYLPYLIAAIQDVPLFKGRRSHWPFAFFPGVRAKRTSTEPSSSVEDLLWLLDSFSNNLLAALQRPPLALPCDAAELPSSPSKGLSQWPPLSTASFSIYVLLPQRRSWRRSRPSFSPL